jgi:hypothetical protein
MKTRGRRNKEFRMMDTDELAEATAAYGREMAIDGFGPMTKKARERWSRARRRPGRPARGSGAKAISVSVEQDLLDRSDRLARELGVSRARLIEHGLRIVLANRGEFVRVAERLVTSKRPSQRKRRKSELARMTYDD